MSRPRVVALCLFLVLSLVLPGVAAAQTTSTPGGGTVVATGLNNPRLLTVVDDGTIYVGESGTGGSEQFTAPPPFGNGNRGMSAQLTRVRTDGSKSAVASGLPSLVLGMDVIGVKGVIPSGNDLLFTAGYAFADTPDAYNSGIWRVPAAGGTATRIADVGAVEKSTNPDGLIVETDVYGLAQAPDGTIYTADAGGNTIYAVNPANGQVTRVATLGGIPSPMPNPGRGGRMERDPVPTGITIGPDASLYVATLGGFPFTPGARIVKLSQGQGTEVAGGLLGMTDLDFGPDGKIYAVEFGAFSLTSQPPGWAPNSGRIIRVGMDGSKEIVISGLNQPNGLAFDSQGRLYVTENSASGPSNTTAGRILRYDASQLRGSAYPAPAAPPAAAPAAAAPAAQAPTQLPRTGDFAPFVPALAGIGALLVGWRVRRRD